MARGHTVMLVLIALALAGCADETAPAEGTPDGPVVVTSPDDYSYLQNGTSPGSHLHDYWHGQDRITVMDADSTSLPLGFAGGAQDIPVHEYRPGTDEVVPQGALQVDVTLTWEEGSSDVYSAPSLWVQTAADHEPLRIADVERGDAVRMTIDESAWDLPHQRLSAWIFQLRVSADPTLGFARFQGTGHIVVEAERGLPLPLYPAHPDHWGDAEEILLLDATGQVAYIHDPGNGGCDGISCQVEFRPDEGVIVPPDTDHVVITLARTYGSPTELGVQFHGAASRAFERPDGMERAGIIEYVVPVVGDGDGPYALQSLWAFMVYNAGPIEDLGAVEEYRITATAYKS